MSLFVSRFLSFYFSFTNHKEQQRQNNSVLLLYTDVNKGAVGDVTTNIIGANLFIVVDSFDWRISNAKLSL